MTNLHRAKEAIEQRQQEVSDELINERQMVPQYLVGKSDGLEEALMRIDKEERKWITDKSVRPIEGQECWVTFYEKDSNKNWVRSMDFELGREGSRLYYDYWDDGGCLWLEFGKEIAWMPRDEEPEVYGGTDVSNTKTT